MVESCRETAGASRKAKTCSMFTVGGSWNSEAVGSRWFPVICDLTTRALWDGMGRERDVDCWANKTTLN